MFNFWLSIKKRKTQRKGRGSSLCSTLSGQQKKKKHKGKVGELILVNFWWSLKDTKTQRKGRGSSFCNSPKWELGVWFFFFKISVFWLREIMTFW